VQDEAELARAVVSLVSGTTAASATTDRI
jgi:hypothetical protein